MTAVLLLILAVVFVAFGALMAAVDAALSVTGRQDLRDLAASGRAERSLLGIADHPATHVNAVVLIRVLVETAAAVLVTVAFTSLFDNIWWAMLAAAVLMTGISFVVVGASPRSVGRQHARELLRATAPIVRGVGIVLGPLAKALVALGQRVTPGVTRGTSFASEEQLLSIIDEAASQDLIEADDRDLIHSVFDFTDRYVREVMVPRTDMTTVAATASMEEAMNVFLEKGVSRVPVVDDDADDVVGVLYLKDVVQIVMRREDGWRTDGVATVARRAVFVPESMRAETLLQQMKREAVHVCLVVDEYGGVSGLVTLEDIIEELVGEISDEYDVPAAEIVEVAPGEFRVSARLSLDEVGDLLGIELADEDVDSIGGLLGKVLGRVPEPGAEAEYGGIRLAGGTSRGRGRGLATVIVGRGPVSELAADGTPPRSPRTSDIRTVRKESER